MTPARIPALSTASPGPLVPAILATQPNALRLVKSLSRCWGRAALLGVLCATAAAVATWFLMPPAKAAARTLVRVPPGLLTEAVDATRTQLLCAARDESLRVLMVTSAGSGEGKTSLSTHLAASLAQVGHRTLLIDGDLRHPVVHRMFELESEPGFSELLRGEARPNDVIVQTASDNLSILPAGRWDPTASRALAREEVLGPMLEEFRESYDFVVIDTSPVLLVTDALIMGQHADGTILSVLRGVSRIPSVYAARERLAAAGVCVLGAVVNGVRSDTTCDYYYAAPAGAPSGRGDK